METDRLRGFCAIAETGSLSQAAELVGLSHSGLSKAMGVLQRELGYAVLRPVGRGLELTEEGRQLYPKAKALLGLVSELSTARAPVQVARIRVGLTEALSQSLAGRMAVEVESEMDIWELDSGEIERSILDGTIDFGFTFVPFPSPELVYEKVGTVELSVFVSQRAEFALNTQSVPFVVPLTERQDNPMSFKSRDGWPDRHSRRTVFRASSLAAASTLVTEGQAAIFAPRILGENINRFLDEASQWKAIPWEGLLAKETRREVFLVKKKSIQETRQMKLFCRVVRKYCR